MHTPHNTNRQRHEPDSFSVEVPRQRLLSKIEPTEVGAVLKNLRVNGAPLDGRILDKKFIFDCGMEPHYGIKFGGRQIYFSKQVFPINGRQAILAFVEEGKTLSGEPTYVARSFYRSNSQGGSWRYLPAIERKDGRLGWYHKGRGENSLSLPTELFAAICEIRINSGEARHLSKDKCELLFSGTARDAFINPGKQSAEPITYFGEVRSKPAELERELPGKQSYDPNSKSTALYPDFNKCTASFLCEYPLAGETTFPGYLISRRAGAAPEESKLFQIVPQSQQVGDVTHLPINLPDGVSITFNNQFSEYVTLNQITCSGRMIFKQVGPRYKDICNNQWHKRDTVSLRFDEDGRVLGIKLQNGDEYDLLYHTAMVRRFESKEPVTPSGPKLEYLFHSVDNRLTTMIGSILLPSKVTSLGLYPDWINNKDLLAPIWEYIGQIPDKGHKRKRDGSYEEVVEDHHLDIPIFEEFRERFAGVKPGISKVYVGG